ncbi:MAG: efflux RND transporter periplasmic adaptor subunit, partial [Chitinophagaceae bacterium]
MQDLFRSIVCVVTLGSLIACSQKKNDQANQAAAGAGKSAPPLAVEAMILQPQPLSSIIEVPGSLLAYEETEIRAEISGRVVKINFKEGSTVKQGDVLIKLFDEDLQAQLKKLQVQLQIAKKTAERQKELVKINGISQQEYDLSALQVSNLEADIELIRVSINKTVIKAPYSGRLGLK